MARRPTDMVNLRLRLPEELRQTLANEAEKANRSLNSEILFRLSRTIGPEWEELVGRAQERERREEEEFERILRSPRMQESLKRVIADLRAGKFKEKKD